VNLLDTPGYADFVGEVLSALRVVDAAVVVLKAEEGVEVGTGKVWEYVEQEDLPAILCVSCMDRERASFSDSVASAQESFGERVVPAYLSIGEAEGFKGVVDLLAQKAYEYSGPGKFSEIDVPAELAEEVAQRRETLVERIAEADDALLEKYLEGTELTLEELRGCMQKAIAQRQIYPVVPVSSTKLIGVAQLLDLLAESAPSPLQRGDITGTIGGDEVTRSASAEEKTSALVFKTISELHLGELFMIKVFSGEIKSGTDVYNPSRQKSIRLGQLYSMLGKDRVEVEKISAGDIGAAVKLKDLKTGESLCSSGDTFVLRGIDFPNPTLSMAIEPKAKGDEEKISTGLGKLRDEDPTFRVQVDAELRQTLVEGMGELHMEVIVDRLKRKFGVEVNLAKPRIPYRETIRKKVQVQGRYKKQSGGRGQYGDVWIRFEPQSRNEGFAFENEIVGGVVPTKYIPAVEKGLIEAMKQGVLAGHPVVDLKASLYDGSYHSVDSSDMAFKIAASMAFKKGTLEADPVLLEPIIEISVVVPEESMGDVMGDLSSRRGKIMGMSGSGKNQEIKATVPMGEMYKYATQLRSLTQGKGMYSWEFSHYEEVPKELSEKIIEQAKADKEQEKVS
jgi:elongation factor G